MMTQDFQEFNNGNSDFSTLIAYHEAEADLHVEMLKINIAEYRAKKAFTRSLREQRV